MLVNALYYSNWQGFAGGEKRIQIAKRAEPLDIFKHEKKKKKKKKKRWRQSCSLIGIFFLQRSLQESSPRKSNEERNQRNEESGKKREREREKILSFWLLVHHYRFYSLSLSLPLLLGVLLAHDVEIAERQVKKKKKKEAGKEKKGKREEKETYLTFSIMSSSFSLYSLRRERDYRERQGWMKHPIPSGHLSQDHHLFSVSSLTSSLTTSSSFSFFFSSLFFSLDLSLSLSLFLFSAPHTTCLSRILFLQWKRARMRWVEKRTKTKL